MHLSRIIKLFIAVLFSVSCSCSSAAGNAQIRAEDNIQWSDLIEPEALDNETGEITSVEQIDALAEKISSARVNSAISHWLSTPTDRGMRMDSSGWGVKP